MIGYVTLGTNDIERAARFYDQLLEENGGKRFMETETFIAWSTSPQAPALSVIKPFDGNAATVGNGVMVALAMDSRDKVDALYRKAIELVEDSKELTRALIGKKISGAIVQAEKALYEKLAQGADGSLADGALRSVQPLGDLGGRRAQVAELFQQRVVRLFIRQVGSVEQPEQVV